MLIIIIKINDLIVNMVFLFLFRKLCLDNFVLWFLSINVFDSVGLLIEIVELLILLCNNIVLFVIIIFVVFVDLFLKFIFKLGLILIFFNILISFLVVWNLFIGFFFKVFKIILFIFLGILVIIFLGGIIVFWICVMVIVIDDLLL